MQNFVRLAWKPWSFSMQNYVGLAQPTTVCFVAMRPNCICVESGLKPSTNVAKTPPRGKEIVGLGQLFASGLCATVFFENATTGVENMQSKGVRSTKSNATFNKPRAQRLQRKLAHHCCARAQGWTFCSFHLAKRKNFWICWKNVLNYVCKFSIMWYNTKVERPSGVFLDSPGVEGDLISASQCLLRNKANLN